MTDVHPQAAKARGEGRSRWTVAALAAAIMLILVEVGSHGVILVTRPFLAQEIRRTSEMYAEQTGYIQELLNSDGLQRDIFDADLGWRYRPGFTGFEEHINSAGMRGTTEYANEAPEGLLRVAAFGDSFVYGVEVGYEESWPWFLQLDDERLEVMNYGVGGYGTDQALLRYRLEGRALAPEVVLISFAPINLGRNVNRYRRFLSSREAPWTKPRYLLGSGGELELLPNPVRTLEAWRPYLEDPASVRALGQHDQWYQPLVFENPMYDWSAAVRVGTHLGLQLHERILASDRLTEAGAFNPDSPAFELTVTLLREFAADVREAGAEPVILMLPDRESVMRGTARSATMYAPLVDALAGERIWDVNAAFTDRAGEDIGPWFAPGGHYSAQGNRRVAAWISEQLWKTFRDVY